MPLPYNISESFTITDSHDIVYARQRGKDIAQNMGFNITKQTFIATAISELARNILEYAKKGSIKICSIEKEDEKGKDKKNGIEIVANDEGRGIQYIEEALQDGFTTSGSLGSGLPGTKRLMDEFKIESVYGKGTKITVRKWV